MTAPQRSSGIVIVLRNGPNDEMSRVGTALIVAGVTRYHSGGNRSVMDFVGYPACV